MEKDEYLIVDFDSTFCKLETLEEIAQEALKNNPEKEEIQKEIEEITQKGMRGEISFFDSLQSRLKLFLADSEDVSRVTEKIKNNISSSFIENKDFFRKFGKQVFIVSGGFRECIYPIADDFGIPRENVLANDFIYNDKNEIIGVDEKNFSSQTQGKVRQVEKLNLRGKIFVIGDGWTDFEIKKEHQADFFIVYTENVRRESVIGLADGEAKDFNKVIEFIKSKGEK